MFRMMPTFGPGALLLLLWLPACTPATPLTPGAAITITSTHGLTAAPSHAPTGTKTLTASPSNTSTPTATATATTTVEPSPTVTPLPTISLPRATTTNRPAPSPLPPSPVPVQAGSEEQQVIDLINQIRSQNNLATLTIDARLMAAAEGHSLDMAQHNFFAHEGSAGTSVEDRLTRQGYAWNFYGENLACGYDSPNATVQGWLDSPPHRANLLAAEAHHIGVGYVGDQGGDCRTYWTADFAAGR